MLCLSLLKGDYLSPWVIDKCPNCQIIDSKSSMNSYDNWITCLNFKIEVAEVLLNNIEKN